MIENEIKDVKIGTDVIASKQPQNAPNQAVVKLDEETRRELEDMMS